MSQKNQDTVALSDVELQAFCSDPSVDFEAVAEAQHRAWREEARKVKAVTPFFDKDCLRIESKEFARAALAL
jgi:hypothetical protein